LDALEGGASQKGVRGHTGTDLNGEKEGSEGTSGGENGADVGACRWGPIEKEGDVVGSKVRQLVGTARQVVGKDVTTNLLEIKGKKHMGR